MHTIIQNKREFYIRPFPQGKLLFDIEKELTYTKKNIRFMKNPMWGIVKLYKKEKGCFPIGLLSRIENIFKNNNIEYRVILKMINIDVEPDYSADKYLARDYQIDAIKCWLKSKIGGNIKHPTSAGKSQTAITIINSLKVPTLIIVPTVDLRIQWEHLVKDMKNVRVRLYQGLKNKKYLQQFTLIVLDENHHASCKTIYKIGCNLNEKAVILGLSATPFLREEDNLKVEAIVGPSVHSVTRKELIEKDFITDAEVIFHKLKDYTESGMYQEIYKEYIVENYERNNKIVEIAKTTTENVLILVNQIEHGEILLSLLNDEDVIFLNGKMNDEERKNNKHKIIIATPIYDEGVNIPELHTLILAGAGKSAIKTIQRVGRILRKLKGKKKAIVHDFMDMSKYLEEHYLDRRKILEEDFNITVR